MIWEVANEYANVGLAGNEAFVTELGALVKALDPDALMNYSAPRDAQAAAVQWMRPPADFVSVHVSRDRGARRVPVASRACQLAGDRRGTPARAHAFSLGRAPELR